MKNELTVTYDVKKNKEQIEIKTQEQMDNERLNYLLLKEKNLNEKKESLSFKKDEIEEDIQTEIHYWRMDVKEAKRLLSNNKTYQLLLLKIKEIQKEINDKVWDLKKKLTELEYEKSKAESEAFDLGEKFKEDTFEKALSKNKELPKISKLLAELKKEWYKTKEEIQKLEGGK